MHMTFSMKRLTCVDQDDIWQAGVVVQQIALEPYFWKRWDGHGSLQTTSVQGEGGHLCYLSDTMLGIIYRMMQEGGKNKFPSNEELQRLKASGSIYQDRPSSSTVADLIADSGAER